MTYYIKGGSRFNEANPTVWVALNLAGFPDAKYLDADWKQIDYENPDIIDAQDPFWLMGSVSGGAKELELGLYNDYRIKFETTGITYWDGDSWEDLLVSGGVEVVVITEAELQTAIDNIGAGHGTIVINADITLTGSIDFDPGGSVILKGQGDETVITTADADCFDITAVDSLVIQDLKIDCSAFTTGKNVFHVNEASDNPVYIERVYVVGTQGTGVLCTSDNIHITDCKISGMGNGVNITGNYNWIANCLFEAGGYGVNITGGDFNWIRGCFMNNCVSYGVYMNEGSNYNKVYFNRIYSVARGIYLYGASGNWLVGNDITYSTYYAIVGYHPSTPNADNNIIAYNNCSYTQSADSSNDRGGIILAANCDDWLIIGNFCSYNTNSGSGSGHGIKITIASANENSVIGNHLRLGNNIAYADVGTATYTSGNHT